MSHKDLTIYAWYGSLDACCIPSDRQTSSITNNHDEIILINLSLLSDIGMSLLAFLVYGGAIALACYLIMKLLSKPLVSMISRVTLIQEKKSILRPVPEDVRAIISKGVRNEAELTYLLKSLAQENGWKSEDVAKIPTWLLTGHIIMDANPNLPYEFSKRDSGYRETDMN